MIKAVIFDWGGTIAVAEAPWDTISERIADRLQLKEIYLEPTDIKKSIDKATQYRREQAKLGVELNSYQFFNHALGLLGHTVDVDITDELEQYVYEMTTPVFADGLDETLMELSEDYKLALLSNVWLEGPRQSLRDLGYDRWFDAMLLSCDIGIPKPDPRIFQHILNLLSIEPEEAIMVGDSLDADIKGAIGAGLHAVHFDPDGSSLWSGYKIQRLSDLPQLIQGMCG